MEERDASHSQYVTSQEASTSCASSVQSAQDAPRLAAGPPRLFEDDSLAERLVDEGRRPHDKHDLPEDGRRRLFAVGDKGKEAGPGEGTEGDGRDDGFEVRLKSERGKEVSKWADQ